MHQRHAMAAGVARLWRSAPHRRLRHVTAALVMVTIVAACGTPEETFSKQTPSPMEGIDTTDRGPGSVVSAETVPGIDDSIRSTGATSARIVYRSTSGIDGSGTQVSGTIFEPSRSAPDGGWPIMVLAHGTSGIEQGCAPSLSKNLSGLAPAVASFLKLGFAVAVPDYQGLGTEGVHPYLDSTTAGFNVIDAAKALRTAYTDASTKWGAFGGSQGGAATWAANEQAGTHGAGMDLVGTVSAVPAANFTEYVDLAADRKLSDDQMAAYIWILIGIQRSRPDFDIDLYRSGFAEQNWDVLAGCEGEKGVARNKALKSVSPDDLVPATPQAAADLKAIFASMGLPQRKADAPMLVFYGGKDEFFEPAWTRAAVRRACAMGSVIESVYQPDNGHGDIDTSSFVKWMGERFAGTKPAPDNC